MKCPHCGEELPEGYIYVPSENPESKTKEDSNLNKEENKADFTAGSVKTENKDSEADNCSYDTENTAETTRNSKQYANESQEIPIPVYMPELDNRKKLHFNSRTVKIGTAVIAIAIVACGVTLGISLHGKSELKDRLSGSWEASGSSFPSASLFSGAAITFDDESLTYSESLGMIEINSQTIEYKVVSSDTIEINDTKYKIEFKGTNSMTITPGLSGTSSETWLKDNSYTDNNYNSDQSGSVV